MIVSETVAAWCRANTERLSSGHHGMISDPAYLELKRVAAERGVKVVEVAWLAINGEKPPCVHCGSDKCVFRTFLTGYHPTCVGCSTTRRVASRRGNRLKRLELENPSFALISDHGINQGKVKVRHECGHVFDVWAKNGRSVLHCPRCGCSTVSKTEMRLADVIRSWGVEVVQTYRLNNTRNRNAYKSVDVYLPEHRVGVEVNGVHWHADYKRKHVEKLEKCEELGIRLMQFTDVQLKRDRDLVLSTIRTACGLNEKVGARECRFDPAVSSEEYRDFVEANHLQGYAAAGVKLGLRDAGGKLLQVMSFSRDRFSKGRGRWELVRLCTLSGVSVVGGAARLFSKRPAGPVFAYCQRDHFTGRVYAELGMTLERVTGPGYFWFRNGETVTRYRAQKHKLSGLLGDQFVPELSEDANMRRAGWRKYYDCGCQVWVTS